MGGGRGVAAALLLGIAACAPSPRTDAPAGTGRTAPPVPGLNHVYLVLDQPTFDAVRASPDLAAILGRTDTGLPNHAAPDPGVVLDRVFFRGRQTYLELFAPDNRFDEPVGKIGIAIGLDDADQLAAVEREWQAVCGRGYSRVPVDWSRTVPPIPWYHSIGCEDTGARSDLAIWAMTYRPEFARWQAGTGGANAGIDRRAILAPRARAGQGRFDIASVSVRADPDLRRRLVAQLVPAGFVRTDGPGVTRLIGDGWELVLEHETGPARAIAIGLKDGARPDRPVPLGSARLVPDARGGAARLVLAGGAGGG